MPERNTIECMPIDERRSDEKSQRYDERTREQAPLIWDIYDQNHKGVVQVLGKSWPLTRAGSGFVVSDNGLVVTALHAVKDARSVDVRTDDGKLHHARIVDADRVNDIAVLQLESGKHSIKAVQVGTANALHKGDDLVSLGYPNAHRRIVASEGTFNRRSTTGALALQLGGWNTVLDETRVLLNKSNSTDRGYAWAAFCAPSLDSHIHLEPGSSGGPVFSKSGEVAGVVRKIAAKDHSRSDLVPADKVKNLLERKEPSYEVKHSYTSNQYDYSPQFLEYGNMSMVGLAAGLRFVPRTTFSAVAIGATALLASDYNSYKDAFSDRLANKYSWAMASDAPIIAGALVALAFRNPAIRVPAALVMGAGLIGRGIATECITTNPKVTSLNFERP